MGVVLVIATLLGGIAAAFYFWDKYKKKDKWQESGKVVNNTWWESSELKKSLETKGYKFRWSNSDSVEERKANGYEIIYEEDRHNRRKYKLINKSGQVLIGKIDT